MCLVLKHGYVSFFVSFAPMGVGRIILSPSVQDQAESKLLETPGITLPYFLFRLSQALFYLYSCCVSLSVLLIDWNYE
jgi:hypothetical protein